MHLSVFLQFEHFTDCSIREYRSILDELSSVFQNLEHLPIMLALCQHNNTLAYYAFYYAGIFDAGLNTSYNSITVTRYESLAMRYTLCPLAWFLQAQSHI